MGLQKNEYFFINIFLAGKSWDIGINIKFRQCCGSTVYKCDFWDHMAMDFVIRVMDQNRLIKNPRFGLPSNLMRDRIQGNRAAKKNIDASHK